ncbi:MAG: hypothetical protein AB8B99_20225 [Phormidesmis sp.]
MKCPLNLQHDIMGYGVPIVRSINDNLSVGQGCRPSILKGAIFQQTPP